MESGSRQARLQDPWDFGTGPASRGFRPDEKTGSGHGQQLQPPQAGEEVLGRTQREWGEPVAERIAPRWSRPRRHRCRSPGESRSAGRRGPLMIFAGVRGGPNEKGGGGGEELKAEEG